MGNNSSTETKACVVMEPSLRGSVHFTRAWLKLVEFVPEYADQTIAPTALPIDSFRTNLWDVTEDLHREFGILAYDGCERTQAWDIPFTAILEAAIGSPADDRNARANAINSLFRSEPNFDETHLTVGHLITLLAVSFKKDSDRIFFLHPTNGVRLVNDMRLIEVWESWKSEFTEETFKMISRLPFRALLDVSRHSILEYPVYQLRCVNSSAPPDYEHSERASSCSTSSSLVRSQKPDF